MSGISSRTRPFRPLRRRVVAWALLYSAIFTLLMTAVLIGVHYLDEREAVLEQLHFAAASYRKSLANSLWELDMPAVRLQLDALANFPMIGRVMLTTSIGQTIEVGKQAIPSSKPEAQDPLSWKEALISPDHPDYVVGQLHLYVDRPALLHRIEASAMRILGGEVVKGLAFGLLMAWLISTLVTRHLSHMARQVSSLHPPALGPPIALQRRAHPYQDELDQLRDAFNQLNSQLAEYIDTQRELEAELRHHRDKLSDMVTERTRSLERLRGFHSLIIRVLTRFINLPPAQTSSAVDHGLSAFGAYFSASRCLLLVHDPAQHGFRIVNAWPERTGEDDIFLDDEVVRRCMRIDGKSRIWLCGAAETGDADARLLALLASNAYTLVGVEIKGNTSGLLCVLGRAIALDSDNASLLDLAARVAANMQDHKTAQLNLLATQQALQQANRELHMMSRHDPLTGLANRRHFDDIKDVEFRRALRAACPLSVLMCDIDEFKRYNDTYGHAQGDRCLMALAACLSPLFGRAGELVVRLGGEEFAVLLPDTDARRALEMAQRMHQAAWNMNLPHASSSVADRVTISVGGATLKHGVHRDFDALLQEADLALYSAKKERNRVSMAE